MITLQPSKEISPSETLPKKRKWDQDIHENPTGNLRTTKPILEQNQTQLPPEWQQCLDIKSGKAYLYNTRTTQRAFCNNPKLSTNTYNDPHPMSLELELNLPHQTTCINGRFMDVNMAKDIKGLARSPSWLTLEGKQQEMVAAVCKKCYMLVMMSKSSRSCPNCKFVHPFPNFLVPRLGLVLSVGV